MARCDAIEGHMGAPSHSSEALVIESAERCMKSGDCPRPLNHSGPCRLPVGETKRRKRNRRKRTRENAEPEEASMMASTIEDDVTRVARLLRPGACGESV